MRIVCLFRVGIRVCGMCMIMSLHDHLQPGIPILAPHSRVLAEVHILRGLSVWPQRVRLQAHGNQLALRVEWHMLASGARALMSASIMLSSPEARRVLKRQAVKLVLCPALQAHTVPLLLLLQDLYACASARYHNHTSHNVEAMRIVAPICELGTPGGFSQPLRVTHLILP